MASNFIRFINYEFSRRRRRSISPNTRDRRAVEMLERAEKQREVDFQTTMKKAKKKYETIKKLMKRQNPEMREYAAYSLRHCHDKIEWIEYAEKNHGKFFPSGPPFSHLDDARLLLDSLKVAENLLKESELSYFQYLRQEWHEYNARRESVAREKERQRRRQKKEGSRK
uniref:Uncharacterized protein n=1 Tax=Caenorhabditis japonica TaxID=281687 RepID=A0A8R1HRA2_CAEJA